ncbi:hypothetical protein SH449x_001198 [Pirellulaceae bacterium SH449]
MKRLTATVEYLKSVGRKIDVYQSRFSAVKGTKVARDELSDDEPPKVASTTPVAQRTTGEASVFDLSNTNTRENHD